LDEEETRGLELEAARARQEELGDLVMRLILLVNSEPDLRGSMSGLTAAQFEMVADSLALALSRRQAVQALKEREGNLRQLFENMEEGFAVHDDITERKRAEEELHIKNELLENIFATSTDFIFVKDRQLRTIMCNEAFSRLLGKRPEDLVGKTDIENGWDPEHVKGNAEKGIVGYEQSDLEALRGKMVRTVYDWRTTSGKGLVVDSIKQPLRNSAGEITGLLGISRDISDQVATRAALENRERELESSTRELRELNEHLVRVREDERRSFAREIHDELGQRLTALNLGLYAVMDDLEEGRDDLRARLDSLVGLNKEAIAEIQSLASRMRPRILDDLGLASALEWLVADQGARGGPLISLEQDLDEDRITPELGTVVFRLVQESLTNIVRHAQAGHAIVVIRMNEHKLFVKVEDDGVGIATEKMSDRHSFGILGMRERALSLGGSFVIRGEKGKGTVVAVELPLGESAEAKDG
jgi:PAS domain S-box-containing protein